MEPAHVGQRSFGVAADCDELGGNGDRDFFGSDCANIQTDGSVDFLEKRFGKAFLGEFAEDCDRLSFRTNHPYVASRSLYRPTEDTHVVAVTASDDDDI